MGFLVPCLVVSSLVAAPEFEVQPVDGTPVRGQIQSLDSQQLTLLVTSSSGGTPEKTTFPITQVAGIVQCEKPRPPKADPDAVTVELTDGSSLQLSAYNAKGAVGELVLASGETVSVPTENVLTVRLQRGSEAALAEWARIVAAKSVGDLLVTSKQGNLDYHQGVIHDIGETHVDFEVDGDTLHVKREKVYGLQYYHGKPVEKANPVGNNANGFRIVDFDASQWVAADARIDRDGEKLNFSVPGMPVRQCNLGSIYSIDLSQGKIEYLSDLKPDKAVYTPFFPMRQELAARSEMFRARGDRNSISRPLQIQGREFRKGLSLHSRSEMAWTLPAGFTHFVATAGIDDEMRPQGRVRLMIRGDDKILFDAPVAGADAAKDIRLSVAGVHRLTILADFGDSNDASGQLDLGNARLFK